MQISFDPRDRDSCASVIAAISALHGSAPFDRAAYAETAGYADFSEGGTQNDRLVPEAVDPADVFDGADAGAAFIGGPLPGATAATTGTVPPAPPAPTGPTAVPAASPSNPGGVPVDSSGLPWDARIHSGPADKKPTNSDGTWRRKRGTSDEEAARVTAELRAAMAAPAAAPVAPPPPPAPVEAVVTNPPYAPPPPPPPAAEVPVAPLAAPVAAPAPTPPVAPVAPPPTPAVANTASGAAAAAPATDFAGLMRKITSLQSAGKLTIEGTSAICQSLGITSVRDLLNRPDLIPSVDMLLPSGD